MFARLAIFKGGCSLEAVEAICGECDFDVFDALAAITYCVLISFIKGRQLALAERAATLDSVRAGLRFMRKTKVILAAITLDMFAVLFGGAVALLPIYATDILKVGAPGLGIMRAAPSVGALLTAFILAHLPLAFGRSND